MPIAALPQATVQLLGSAQVLTTPTSLVKELIDNALDAKATSIDVLISKNTLAKLEVRDNGHGISSEDFDSLGKRGHTSKLRTFEELKFVGGISLGFRGEALASAVQLGEVSVTTKSESSRVATRLLLKAPGGVDQKSSTSHPVGTTVSISKFMYKIPVRKKTFEKEASKTLAKINQMLRSYALARPSIRFSLKIKEGGKGSWSFSPRPHDGIKEAVSLVIGRDAAMDCIEKTITSAERPARPTTLLSESQHTKSSIEDLQVEDGSFVIEAFLPKPDADPSKLGTGQYLSIDSRPVSHEKGTMKKIVTLFKKHIRSALSDASDKVKNPFIRLNIKCPVASYDANVEPSKDDMLFGNEHVVLELAENLLKDIYGELKPVSDPTSSKPLANDYDNFDLLLAREPAVASTKEVSGDAVPTPEPSLAVPKSGLHPQIPSSSSPTLRASSPLSREAIAIRESPIPELGNTGDEQSGNGGRKWGVTMSKDFCEEVSDGRQRGRAKNTFRLHPQPTPDRDVSDTPLNPWIIAKMTAPITRNRATSDDPPINRPLSETVSQTQLQSDPPVDLNRFTPHIRQSPQTSRSDDTLKLFVSRRYSASSIRPQFNEERLADEIQPLQPRALNDFVSARDLAWAMDFEQRKEDATRRLRREEIRAAEVEDDSPTSSRPVRSSPHKNRYNAAIASLQAGQLQINAGNVSGQAKVPLKTSLPDGDPRAYLMKRQKSFATQKKVPGGPPAMIRAKSTRLPLETIPQEQRLYDLIYNVSTDMEKLKRAMEVLVKEDSYVRRGGQIAGLNMKAEERPLLTSKLRDTVNQWIESGEGREYEVQYDFSNLLDS
jgi:DNA mismatch repair protein MutL